MNDTTTNPETAPMEKLVEYAAVVCVIVKDDELTHEDIAADIRDAAPAFAELNRHDPEWLTNHRAVFGAAVQRELAFRERIRLAS